MLGEILTSGSGATSTTGRAVIVNMSKSVLRVGGVLRRQFFRHKGERTRANGAKARDSLSQHLILRPFRLSTPARTYLRLLPSTQRAPGENEGDTSVLLRSLPHEAAIELADRADRR